jgi:hypothetical protein
VGQFSQSFYIISVRFWSVYDYISTGDLIQPSFELFSLDEGMFCYFIII